MQTEKNIENFVDNFCRLVWKKLRKKGVKGVGVTGSYAGRDYSRSRPDINFAIFAEERTPRLLLEIGQIISDLNEKYSRFFNLRPEYHPDRFVYPWGRNRNKLDLFFKIAIFELKHKDSLMPFGRPGFVVEGHKLSIKMYHGKNCFKHIRISSSNEEVIKGNNLVLSQWTRSIKFTPFSYNLNKDTDLFFNESLVWGKLAVQQFAWVQGIKNGLDYSQKKDRAEIFDKVHNKEKLRKFLELPRKEKEMVGLILDARLNYDNWKNDKKLARKLYLASFHLLKFFLGESEKIRA
jgi:predicted nucleotidyltransferase